MTLLIGSSPASPEKALATLEPFFETVRKRILAGETVMICAAVSDSAAPEGSIAMTPLRFVCGGGKTIENMPVASATCMNMALISLKEVLGAHGFTQEHIDVIVSLIPAIGRELRERDAEQGAVQKHDLATMPVANCKDC